MAQFPVEIDDSQAINEAINYLLSGPAGLGQNFEGFSAYQSAVLRPSARQPWSLDLFTTLNAGVYVNIPISNAAPVGGNPSQYVTFTFATAQGDIPFQPGDTLEVYDIVDSGGGEPYNYDRGYTVYACTLTDVTIYTESSYNWNTYVSGGWVGRNFTGYELDTDCNARVTITSKTGQVFVSAQMKLQWDYDVINPCQYDVRISIYRFKGFPDRTPGSNDYLFADRVLVSEQIVTKTVASPIVGATDYAEAIFTTVLDGPNIDFGYYWYILAIQFDVPYPEPATTPPAYDVLIGKVTTGFRSLTAQVIKQ